jgi:short-subunit dehydrogenase
MAEVDAVDVLVNNAAFGLYEAVEGISVDEARYQFGMNVSGPARFRHLVLPAMRVKGFGA